MTDREHEEEKSAEEAVRLTPVTPTDEEIAKTDESTSDVVYIGGACQVRGEIRNCRRLEIEGVLEGDLETEEIVVREGGKISGHIKTMSAEIHGDVEGQLDVEELLDVHSTGFVDGDVNYGKLAVASGGQVVGTLKRSPVIAAARPDHKKRTAAISYDNNGQQASISKIIDGLMQNKD